MLIAAAVFLLTLVLVIWQPRGLGVGWSAALGALLALVVGAVSLQDIPTVWAIVWNATATFIAVIIISLLLDEAGFFEWAALHVARWARQRPPPVRFLRIAGRRRIRAVRQRRGRADPHPHRHIDAAGAALLRRDDTGLRHGGRVHRRYRQPPTGGVEPGEHRLGGLLRPGFRRVRLGDGAGQPGQRRGDIAGPLPVLPSRHPGRFVPEALRAPVEAIRDRPTFIVGWWVLLLLLVGLFALEPLGIPISVVAAICAAILFAVAARGHVISTRRVLREAPGRSWSSRWACTWWSTA